MTASDTPAAPPDGERPPTYRRTGPRRAGQVADPAQDLAAVERLIAECPPDYPGLPLMRRRRDELAAAVSPDGDPPAPPGVYDVMRVHGIDPATYRPPVVATNTTAQPAPAPGPRLTEQEGGPPNDAIWAQPAPAEPGYGRIAEAIDHALDSSDLRVVVKTAAGPIGGDHWRHLWVLARCLDKAGLIDWSAFDDAPAERPVAEPTRPDYHYTVSATVDGESATVTFDPVPAEQGRVHGTTSSAVTQVPPVLTSPPAEPPHPGGQA